MPAGDSMPDTYIAIMLQSLKKKEQVLDEIIRLDDRQKDTLTDPDLFIRNARLMCLMKPWRQKVRVLIS